MDPTTVFCPNRHCHARGQTGRGNISIHSRKEQRFICHECQKTFSARKGTVFYRLRTSAETVVIVVTLLAQGCPCKRLWPLWVDERTIAAWWARSGHQGQAVHIWSNNHATWGRCKPMSCASRNRAASCGWRAGHDGQDALMAGRRGRRAA